MKKLIILGLVLLMVVVFGTAALAKAVLHTLVPYLPAYAEASGKAIVNNSEGDSLLEITVSAKGLEAYTDYFVYIGDDGGNWTNLGTFTTNANGNGNFHINVREDLFPSLLVKYMAINLEETNARVLMDEDYPLFP